MRRAILALLVALPAASWPGFAAGSSGDQAGIRAGDAILEVNRQPVADVEAFRRLLAEAAPGSAVPIYVQRGGGRNEYVVLTVPEPRR